MKKTCGQCGAAFEGEACPWCGGRREPAGKSLLKTSTILISTGTDKGIYRSLADVPQPLRKKLLRSTTGANAGTILIADRRGREELSRALGRMPVSWRKNAPEAADEIPDATSKAMWWRAGASLTLGLGLILLWLMFFRG